MYQYLVKYIYSASGKAFLICLHHIFPLFLKVPQYTHISSQHSGRLLLLLLLLYLLASFAVLVKVQKRKALQKGFFFLAFIGWMSAALMAVLCRLKGRGKKGQKMGGVHVFSCNYSRYSVCWKWCTYILQSEETSCKIGKKGCFFAPPIPYSLSLLRQAIFTQKKGK